MAQITLPPVWPLGVLPLRTLLSRWHSIRTTQPLPLARRIHRILLSLPSARGSQGSRAMASRLRVTLLLAACLLAGRAWAMEMDGMAMEGARHAGLACWWHLPLADDDRWRGRVGQLVSRLHAAVSLLPRTSSSASHAIPCQEACSPRHHAQAAQWPPPLLPPMAACACPWAAAAATRRLPATRTLRRPSARTLSAATRVGAARERVQKACSGLWVLRVLYQRGLGPAAFTWPLGLWGASFAVPPSLTKCSPVLRQTGTMTWTSCATPCPTCPPARCAPSARWAGHACCLTDAAH